MTGRVLLLAGTLLLGGCYSMQGSERILDRDGMVTREVVENSIFRADFEKAFKARKLGPSVPQTDVDAMLSSGFTQIYTYCDSYFDAMGLQQRKSRVIRDAIAPISALMTGVIALDGLGIDSGDKENVLALLGLATAASSSILDIYDEHMLFGAENIGAVETLTLNAVTEHASRVQQFSTVSYDAAIRHLLKNQSICSPQHILSLTREAIKEGTVIARAADDTTPHGTVGTAATRGSDANRPVNVSIENR